MKINDLAELSISYLLSPERIAVNWQNFYSLTHFDAKVYVVVS